MTADLENVPATATTPPHDDALERLLLGQALWDPTVIQTATDHGIDTGKHPGQLIFSSPRQRSMRTIRRSFAGTARGAWRTGRSSSKHVF